MRVIHRDARSRHGRTRGFSLIEVLITLFILSFGMLGVAATQTQALRAQRNADAQSQVVQRVGPCSNACASTATARWPAPTTSRVVTTPVVPRRIRYVLG